MKGIFPAVLSIFLLFVLLGAKNVEENKGAQDVMKELDDFQKSLSNWMKNLDTLGSQFTALQKNVNDSMSPLKDMDKLIKGIEDKLNLIATRVESVEKSSSVGEVKGMLDSFNKTFDVLKKLLSDLTKRVEDQEIKSTVLEKKLFETQKPLEPIKKAIDELTKSLTDKFGEQEKRLSAAEDSMKTRMSSVDTMLKTFDVQFKQLADLDVRVKKIEKSGTTVAGTATTEAVSAAQGQAPVGTETAKTGVGTGMAEVVKEHIPTPEEEGFTEVGDGFYVRNVNIYQFGSSAQIRGEIKNMSDGERSIAMFVIRVYNASNAQLFTQDFSIKTFKKGEIRPFSEIISGLAPSDIARYEITPKRRY